MTGISDYLVKVICASLLCGILNHIIKGSGTVPTLIKAISGVFVAITILSPLVSIKFNQKLESINKYLQVGNEYSSYGERIAEEQKSEIIKSATQTYILDKAISLGVELEVEVVLSGEDDNPYRSVLLRGNISPYAKDQLSQMISTVLGIPEEAQQWIN